MTYVIYIKRCQSSSYEWMFQNTDDLFFYRPTTILDLSKLFWRWPNILDMVQNVNFSSKKLFLSGSKHFVLIEGKGISNAFKNFDNYFTPLCVHSKIRGYEMYTCANTRDIHIECSKQFKWNSYFYVSGQSRPFWAGV